MAETEAREPDAVAESLQAVLKQSSSAWQDVSEDDKTKKRKCREEDLDDFRQRLSTFKTHWWFNKPLAFSALAAARRGWQNAGQDQLCCPVCGAELKITCVDGHWQANGQQLGDASSGAPHEILEKGHCAFCPWRSVEVKNDPQQYSDKELAADVDKRRAGLLALKHLPVVIEGEQEAANPADALASAGWEAAGTADGRDFIRCPFCLRTHIVQSFAYRIVNEEEGEGQRHPPMASLWTPKIRVSSDQAERMTWFDPHAFHHYYCPLFCHPQEELGVAAARMLKAGSSPADPNSGTDMVLSAAEKAENLLRGLHVILPVDQD